MRTSFVTIQQTGFSNNEELEKRQHAFISSCPLNFTLRFPANSTPLFQPCLYIIISISRKQKELYLPSAFTTQNSRAVFVLGIKDGKEKHGKYGTSQASSEGPLPLSHMTAFPDEFSVRSHLNLSFFVLLLFSSQ